MLYLSYMSPLSPDHLKKLLKRLGLSQRKAAKDLGVNERTMRRWIAGDAKPPESVRLLLETWAKK